MTRLCAAIAVLAAIAFCLAGAYADRPVQAHETHHRTLPLGARKQLR